jgi:pimeloyl-ACP methyl ester carboxylesterase
VEHEREREGLPLALLHGGSGRRQWFAGLVPLLPEHVVPLLVDLPGHGESPWLRSSYSIGSTAELVADALAAVDRPVLFGHSHGGHVALALAARRAHAVRGLVIGDAPLDVERLVAHWRVGSDTTRAWRAIAAAGVDAPRATALLAEAPAPAGGTLGDVFGQDHPYLREMGASLAAHDPEFLDMLLDDPEALVQGLDPHQQLAQVTCPVLLLQADPAAGGLLTDDDVAVVHDLVDDVTVVRLDGVSHGLQLQDPDAVAAALGPWLARFADSEGLTAGC